MLKFRSFYFIATLSIFAIEIFIALFIHDGFIRPYLGDFLVVILIYCFVRSFINVAALPTAIGVLLFSYFVEVLQYIKIVEKLNLQTSKLARVIIGTSFAWVDLLAYTLGIIFVLSIEKIVHYKRRGNEKVSNNGRGNSSKQKMTVKYKDYSIDIIDDPGYSLNSADNIVQYDKEYFEGTLNDDSVYPTSKHGIRIKQNGNELSSAIICEIGGATGIHKNSFLLSDNNLFICCCNKVYSLTLPTLEMNWQKRLDPATCFGIYRFDNDFIIHGELSITRIDKAGNEKWTFGARDIFVTQDETESIKIHSDKIELRDWQGYKYTLDKNGIELS